MIWSSFRGDFIGFHGISWDAELMKFHGIHMENQQR